MPVSRRTLFALVGAGLAAVATGCAVGDPRVAEPTGPRWTPTPSPSPTTVPQVQQALQRESALATRATSIESVAGDRAAAVTAAHDAHLSHADVLSTHFGPVEPPDPSAPAPATDLPEATARWAEELRAAAVEHRTQALAVSGHLGWVFASCSAFASVLAERVATLGFTVDGTDPDEWVPVTDTDALIALLGQLHAARYAYQTALGAFQLADERRDPLEARKDALTDLRDVVFEALVERGLAAPPAEPAYDIPRPADPAAAIALTQGIEQRLLPFLGDAVAGVAGSDALRPVMVDHLAAATRRLVVAGGALPRWPGH